MSILEVLMIVCFGLAWPINLYNSWKSKSTKGKNLLFMSFIVLAYVFGILNKLLVSVDNAIYFYCLNEFMVLADYILYFAIEAGKLKRYLSQLYSGVQIKDQVIKIFLILMT